MPGTYLGVSSPVTPDAHSTRTTTRLWKGWVPWCVGQGGAPVTPACVGHPDQLGFKAKKYRVGIWISPWDDSNRSCLMAVNFNKSHSPLPPRMPEQTGAVISALAAGKWGQRGGADSVWGAERRC